MRSYNQTDGLRLLLPISGRSIYTREVAGCGELRLDDSMLCARISSERLGLPSIRLCWLKRAVGRSGPSPPQQQEQPQARAHRCPRRR